MTSGKLLRRLVFTVMASILTQPSAAAGNPTHAYHQHGYMSGWPPDTSVLDENDTDEEIDDNEANVETDEERSEKIAARTNSNHNGAIVTTPIAREDVNIPKVDGFPTIAYKQALAYFNKYKSSFSNQTYITVIDFTKPSHKKRMFIVNLKTGGVESRLTTHGKGSDPRHSGRAVKFGNSHRSNMTSLGFYRTLGTYKGKNGQSLKLQGLSKTNSNALARAIVMHKANYVSERGGRAGRSQGCFAMDSSIFNAAIKKIKGGSLVYAWSGQK